MIKGTEWPKGEWLSARNDMGWVVKTDGPDNRKKNILFYNMQGIYLKIEGIIVDADIFDYI